MNLGKKLKPQNLELLEQHKELGFSTRTQLIDAALTQFGKLIKKRGRKEWKKRALSTYAESQPRHFWEPVEGVSRYAMPKWEVVLVARYMDDRL